jgi:hypothetical protein
MAAGPMDLTWYLAIFARFSGLENPKTYSFGTVEIV